MNHLDEGTIHAWLDDAVDSTQSGEIEAHIAQCATCSAAVAEARGLVAGASRILNALDDVPANVVPRRAPAVSPAPARRQWRAAPWVTGIAAALMLAIGLTQVSRKGAQETAFRAVRSPAAIASDPVADTATSRTVAASALSEPREQTLGAETAPPAVARSKAVTPPPQQRRDLARSEMPIAITEDVRRVGSARDAAQTTQLRSAAGAGAAQTSPAQAAPAPQTQSVQAAPAPQTQSVQNAPAQQRLDQVVATAAPEAMKSAAPASDVLADAKAQIERLAGCYRIVSQTSKTALGAVVPSVAAAAGRAAGQARTADRPAAARYAAPPPPDMIRLDTARHPLGYSVTEAKSDSSVGSWRMMGRDSVRVDLLAAGLFTFALQNRTACPEK